MWDDRSLRHAALSGAAFAEALDRLLRSHIDSIIQLILGALFTGMGFAPKLKLGARTRTVFRICGPGLIVIGGVLLFQPSGWRRQFTSDRVASAEFPGAPTAKESTDTLGGVSVKRTSFTYDVPGKDIALFLSYSALPEDARGMSAERRLQGSLAYLISQGSRVVEQTQDGAIFRVTLRRDADKATLQMALAYVGDNVYRVVASWTDGHGDSALTDRFVKSFQLH